MDLELDAPVPAIDDRVRIDGGNSTEDRRVVQVELTPDGEAAITGVPAVLCEVMNAHLAGFSKTEWLALKGYLKRMYETGEAMRDAD